MSTADAGVTQMHDAKVWDAWIRMHGLADSVTYVRLQGRDAGGTQHKTCIHVPCNETITRATLSCSRSSSSNHCG